MLIRDATTADLPQILAIHNASNASIAETTAIWDTEQVELSERQQWFDIRRASGHPILTAEIDGRVAGYASYGQWRPKTGYRRTVENSVYVAAGFQRRGVATELMVALIRRAADLGMHVMVAGIESSNGTSIRLHEKFGFRTVGVLPEVGYKFERWLDLTLMQLDLSENTP
ncbi:N-acetyltransferase [Rhodococcoides trifolii]|uniref:N-acetyltransferase n=1 Tax=Rhodococcoides trifolii TaxID=908250 RepID=A0A917FPH4_9NOCA|nr:GNAT family N-acetyltransferase [Rhodococcus trifolii]GGF95925.1 N-acetyltransferase [Rhodococcus trifolii]